MKQRQWLLILEDAKRKKMALDNQRKETSLQQHESTSPDAGNITACLSHSYIHVFHILT